MSGEVTKRGRGHPPYVPSPEDRVLVERLIGLLVPERTIAALWLNPPIAYMTFRKYYKQEIRDGRDKLKGRMRALMLRSAESGNVTAIAYLMSRLDPEFHKLADPADRMIPGFGGLGDGADLTGGVNFYIPENGRDQPDPDDDGPVIEGEATEAA
jgi:hypothetical protein